MFNDLRYVLLYLSMKKDKYKKISRKNKRDEKKIETYINLEKKDRSDLFVSRAIFSDQNKYFIDFNNPKLLGEKKRKYIKSGMREHKNDGGYIYGKKIKNIGNRGKKFCSRCYPKLYRTFRLKKYATDEIKYYNFSDNCLTFIQ